MCLPPLALSRPLLYSPLPASLAIRLSRQGGSEVTFHIIDDLDDQPTHIR